MNLLDAVFGLGRTKTCGIAYSVAHEIHIQIDRGEQSPQHVITDPETLRLIKNEPIWRSIAGGLNKFAAEIERNLQNNYGHSVMIDIAHGFQSGRITSIGVNATLVSDEDAQIYRIA